MTRRELVVGLPAASLFGGAAAIPLGANTAITGFGFHEAVRTLRKIGFPVIEIQAMGELHPIAGAFPGYQFDRLTERDKAGVKAALRGVRTITAHLPYHGLDYFSSGEAKAAAAQRTVEVAIEGSAYFGAVLGVVHPKPGPGLTLDGQWPMMIRVFRRWGDLARARGMRLALETGFPRSVREFVRLIREIDHPAVGATLDVGHQSQYAELAAIAPPDRALPASIRAYNDVNIALIEQLGGKLLHLHVHDIDPASWKEHQPMRTGFVDYTRLIAMLRAIGFTGSLVLEIGGPAARMADELSHARRVFSRYLR